MILVVLLLPAFTTGQAWAGVGLNVAPPKFEFSLRPGGSFTETVTVENKGDTRGHVSAFPMDLSMDRMGELIFSKAGTQPRSLAPWIRVNPTEFELEPGQSQLVRFTVTAPPDALGSYLAVIFFQTRPERLQASGAAVSARVGSILIAHVSGKEVRKGEIVSLTVSPFQPGKPLEVAVTFENKGNWLLRPKGTMKVKEVHGKVVWEASLDEEGGAVLPLTQREFHMKGPGDLPVGNYTVEVALDYGGKEILAAETTFTVAK